MTYVEHKELPLEIQRDISNLCLGYRRPSMKQNPVLSKPKLGVKLDIGRELPKDSRFIYGRPNKKRDGGVPEAFNWNSFTKKEKCSNNPRDFILMNKRSAVCGFATAKEQGYFRAVHDVRVKSCKPPKVKPLSEVLPPGMTYGCKTRTCTPIKEIVQGRFGTTWLACQRTDNTTIKKHYKDNNKNIRDFRMNRAAQLAIKQPKVEDHPLWKMSRWEKVQPHLASFRNPADRKRAFDYHRSDACGRTGAFGHGVLEAGKSY